MTRHRDHQIQGRRWVMARFTRIIALAAALPVIAGKAGAAETGVASAGLEEIIVTAEKRSRSVRDVPIAIAAYDANFIKKTKLDDVKALVDFTPGFAGKSKDSFVDTISVRGISTNDFGAGGDPSIGIFKDGIYQGRSGSAVTSFYDIERAEALRGPQGFLFGRNAVSGAISIITAKPDPEKLSGYGSLGLGERAHYEAEGAVNAPLGNGWALRAAGYYSHEDGYVTNLFAPTEPKMIRHEKGAGRLSLGYRSETLDVTFTGEYEKRNQSGSIYRAINGATLDFFGVTMTGNGRDTSTDFGNKNKDNGDIFSFTSLIDWKLGWATLSSITGFRTHNYSYAEDFDGSPLAVSNYLLDQHGDYYSQEFRLVSTTNDAFTWYAGVSGYYEKLNAGFAQQAGEEVMCQAFLETSCGDAYPGFTPSANGLYESNDVRGRYKGWGAYADATYAFTRQFELNVGLRYTYDRKNFGMRINPVDSELGPFYVFGYLTDGFIQETRNWDDFSPRAVLRYKPNDDWMIWAGITKGYKAGGFGSFSLNIPSPQELGFTPEQIQACNDSGGGVLCVLNPDGTVPAGTKPSAFGPEKVWSYELGVKGRMADNKVDIAVNGYYYKYTNLQLNYFDEVLLNTLVQNVGQVNGYGVEATMRAVANEYLDLFLGGTWSKTSVSKVPSSICSGCDGNRLPQNPEWTFAGVINAHYPVAVGEIFATGEFRYQTHIFGSLDNDPEVSVDAYATVNLRAGFEAAIGWEISAYVENVFNRLYYDGAGQGTFPLPSHLFGPSRPRTFGADLKYSF